MQNAWIQFDFRMTLSLLSWLWGFAFCRCVEVLRTEAQKHRADLGVLASAEHLSAETERAAQVRIISRIFLH